MRWFVATMGGILLASAGFAVACSIGGTGNPANAALGLLDSDAAIDAGPRRVCPSTPGPDGGWVTVDGIDVSDWDYTQWDEVALGRPNLGFALARVSAGLYRVDTRFSADWTGMKRVGLVRGAYQYFTPRSSAVDLAKLFVRRLREEGGLESTDLPPVLDLETSDGMPDATVICKTKIWLANVERETRRTPMIYTSARWSSYFASEFRRYPLWVANYVGSPSSICPRTPDAWDRWQLWQYAEDGAVPGVYVNGSREDDAGGSIELQDGGDAGLLNDADLDFFDGTMDGLRTFVASTTSSGVVDDPPPLVDPPHVSASQLGLAIDCSDGCCVGDP